MQNASRISEDLVMRVVNANRINPYTDITPYEIGIGFPIVNYTGFHPANDEVLIYATPAATFKDKEQVIGYTGSSGGMSVRIAKGASVRTGGTGSKAVRDTVRQTNMGDLLITNKRILFASKDDSFEFQVAKISTVKLLDKNSFVLQAGRAFKNVWLDGAIITYAYALINYSINQYANGTDVCAVIKEAQSKITPEQFELFRQIQMECNSIQTPKSKEEKKMEKRQKAYKRQSGIAKALFVILALVIVGGIIAVVMVSKTTPTSFALGEYDNTEMSITVEEHDTLVFSVIPTTIDKDDVELIVEDPNVAKCLIQDVYSVPDKRLIKISCLGLSAGETTFYVKDKNSDAVSDVIHLTVHEKQIEEDNSRTVYLNHSGNKYHYSASCAGSSAYESTLNQAQKLMKEPCSNCAN